MPEQVLEAHAPGSFLERVQALEPGEVARLEGGVAVKHLALEDGRLAYRVAGPRTWGTGEVRFDDYGDTYRSIEEAVRAAFRKSAESTDPESIGGTTRLTRWAPLEDGGAEVRIQDFTLTGQVIVSAPNQPGATRTVRAESLMRKNQVLASVVEEVGKPGTNWKQVKGEDRKRVNPLVKHYAKMEHGFTQCVIDNTKRFGPEGAKKVCAVVKDMGRRTTHWRKGAKATEAEVNYWSGRLLEAAGGDVDRLEAMMLAYIVQEDVVDRLGNRHAARDGKFVKKGGGILSKADELEHDELVGWEEADPHPEHRRAVRTGEMGDVPSFARREPLTGQEARAYTRYWTRRARRPGPGRPR